MRVGEDDPESAGDYVLDSRLGSGGMGVVYLAHSTSGRRVAVKVVHKQYAADPEFRARFQQEVAAARRVSGAYTAPVLDADADAERPWMATLYVPGPTLSERVKEDGPLDAAELWRLAAGLAEALRDIHRAGVVHRDLKPSNVLLAADGPKVIDFGISRPHDSSLRTETGKVIGTPPFMAPEQFRTPREVGPAADVFALGCLLAHAAQGRGPFDSDSPYMVAYQVVHDEPDLGAVPGQLRELVTRCLAKDPADRPTPDELMAGLRQAPVPLPRPAAGAHSGAADGAADERERDTEAGDGATGPRGAAAQGAGPGGGTGDGPGGGAAAHPGPAGSGRRRHWGRRPALIGAVVAAVLAAGGYVGAQELGSEAAGSAKGDRETAAASARSWETVVGRPAGEDAGQAYAAKCTLGEQALYCAAAGVPVARIDPVDGRVVWRTRASWADRYIGAPEYAGGLAYAVRYGDSLRAYDPRTGATRWSRDVSGYETCCTFAGGVTLAVGAAGEVAALDTATGKKRWSKRLPGYTTPSLGYLAGTVYAFESSEDNSRTLVSAIDPGTGEVRWQEHLDGWLSPADVSDGSLYLLESDTSLFVTTAAVVRFDLASRTTTRTELPYPVSNAMAAVADGTVYILDSTGELLAVDMEKRALLWSLETSVNEPSPPTVAGRRLYLSASDGRLLAVDRMRGRRLGETKPRYDPDLTGGLPDQPPPIVADGRVYAFTPRGSVFSVAASSLER